MRACSSCGAAATTPDFAPRPPFSVWNSRGALGSADTPRRALPPPRHRARVELAGDMEDVVTREETGSSDALFTAAAWRKNPIGKRAASLLRSALAGPRAAAAVPTSLAGFELRGDERSAPRSRVWRGAERPRSSHLRARQRSSISATLKTRVSVRLAPSARDGCRPAGFREQERERLRARLLGVQRLVLMPCAVSCASSASGPRQRRSTEGAAARDACVRPAAAKRARSREILSGSAAPREDLGRSLMRARRRRFFLHMVLTAEAGSRRHARATARPPQSAARRCARSTILAVALPLRAQLGSARSAAAFGHNFGAVAIGACGARRPRSLRPSRAHLSRRV